MKRAVVLTAMVIAIACTWLLLRRPGPAATETQARPTPGQEPVSESRPPQVAARRVRKAGPPKLIGAPKPRAPRFQPKALLELERGGGMPQSVYEAETRHPVWAPAMEKTLRDKIESLARAGGTPGFKLTKVDCRESSCRLDMEYQPADIEAARKAGALDPYHLAREQVRAFATVWSLLKAPPEFAKSFDPEAWVQPDGSVQKKLILVFGEKEIDPETYGETVERWGTARRERLDRARDK
jgi:hypothetical protein